jgi:hypothetical protein
MFAVNQAVKRASRTKKDEWKGLVERRVLMCLYGTYCLDIRLALITRLTHTTIANMNAARMDKKMNGDVSYL